MTPKVRHHSINTPMLRWAPSIFELSHSSHLLDSINISVLQWSITELVLHHCSATSSFLHIHRSTCTLIHQFSCALSLLKWSINFHCSSDLSLLKWSWAPPLPPWSTMINYSAPFWLFKGKFPKRTFSLWYCTWVKAEQSFDCNNQLILFLIRSPPPSIKGQFHEIFT